MHRRTADHRSDAHALVARGQALYRRLLALGDAVTEADLVAAQQELAAFARRLDDAALPLAS